MNGILALVCICRWCPLKGFCFSFFLVLGRIALWRKSWILKLDFTKMRINEAFFAIFLDFNFLVGFGLGIGIFCGLFSVFGRFHGLLGRRILGF